MASLNSPKDMSFVQHLIELRDRLLKIILAITLVLFVLMPFATELFELLAKPLIDLMPEGYEMIAIDVVSPFFTPFKLTLMLSIFLAMPVILYYLWGFIAPGLYKHEKSLVLPLLVSSTLLFYSGIVFAYYVVFPIIFGFMLAMTPDGVAMTTDISRYLDFVLKLIFAFGVAFQVPIVTILLVRTGIVSVETLANKRPHIIVAAFIIGMLMTPPDMISQTLLAIPIWLLFEIGLFIARGVRAKKMEDIDTKPALIEEEKTNQIMGRIENKKD